MTLLKKFPSSWTDETYHNLQIVLEACQKIFDNLDTEISDAKLGLNINSASGGYLDQQGEDFDVIRIPGETDESYRLRIMDEILRQRNTITSILRTVNNIMLTGNSVYEPYTNLFVVGESELSGPDKIIDYDYWDYHVIDVLTRIRPDLVQRALQKMIAAGKTLYVTHIIDIFNKGTQTFQENLSYMEIDIDWKNVPSEVQTIMLSNETLFDFQGIASRHATADSPTLPINNTYPFGDDSVVIPYLQLGFKIKNEIKGVDY